MDVNFQYNAPGKVDPVRIEQVFAEKPGGGRVANSEFAIAPTTAVGDDKGLFKPIKGYRLYKANTTGDSTIQIEKGSGVAVDDVIAFGKKGVKCTKVDNSNEDYDEVTVTLGVEIPAGAVLYQAKEASADAAEPIYKPKFVTGNWIPANVGDFPVRLINGANLRKETALVGEDIADLLPLITLV